ncbi:MAG: TylF/MycF/NovP-related O-methyltransferase [Limisphaerales bacterium]
MMKTAELIETEKHHVNPTGVRLTPDEAIKTVVANALTYCSRGRKLNRLVEAVGEVVRKDVPGVFIEAGVAMGGSAVVIGTAKPREKQFKLYDVFRMLPAPGTRDEPRAHQVYHQFLDGQRTDTIDRKYLAAVAAGMKEAVRSNLEAHGIRLDENHVELIAGDFKDTLHVETPVAFAHIDCDWYDSVKICVERLADRISPGGLLVFDDYASFSGAKQAVDEWLAVDRRFRLRTMGDHGDNAVVERLADTV